MHGQPGREVPRPRQELAVEPRGQREDSSQRQSIVQETGDVAGCKVLGDLSVGGCQLSLGDPGEEPRAENLSASGSRVGVDCCDGWTFLVRLREVGQRVAGDASQKLDSTESPRRLDEGSGVRR